MNDIIEIEVARRLEAIVAAEEEAISIAISLQRQDMIHRLHFIDQRRPLEEIRWPCSVASKIGEW